MFFAVEEAAEKHKNTWQVLPAFTQAHDRFSNLVAQAIQAARDQESGITGATLEKRRARTALVDVAFPVGAAFQSWALAQGKVQLATQTYHPRSDYLHLRDTMAEIYATKLLEEVTPHLDELGDYGITQAELDRLSDAIDAYHALLVSPRTAITDRKAATQALANTVRQANSVLRYELDKLVPLLATSNPEFAVDWWNARNIYDSAGGGTVSEPSTSSAPTSSAGSTGSSSVGSSASSSSASTSSASTSSTSTSSTSTSVSSSSTSSTSVAGSTGSSSGSSSSA